MIKKKNSKGKKTSNSRPSGKRSAGKRRGTKKRFLKKDLNKYREKLLDLKDDFMKQIQEILEESLRKSQQEASGDISSHTLHMADRASDNYERDFNLGLVSSERRIVVEIDEALKRIDDASYGFCQMCNKLIAKQRLDAIPYARYGKKCQKKIEKQEQR